MNVRQHVLNAFKLHMFWGMSVSVGVLASTVTNLSLMAPKPKPRPNPAHIIGLIESIRG
jgi:hypothetical protein